MEEQGQPNVPSASRASSWRGSLNSLHPAKLLKAIIPQMGESLRQNSLVPAGGLLGCQKPLPTPAEASSGSGYEVCPLTWHLKPGIGFAKAICSEGTESPCSQRSWDEVGRR